MGTIIHLSDVEIAYGEETVLRDCSLRMAAGERAALMGPSGCGKTTLLRLIAGLARPQRGTVAVSGRVSFVFQEPRLFPWLTAAQNISIVLPKAEAASAGEWLRETGLAEAAEKYPAELSGGMRQRVALCRALAYGGDILLLDEAFQGLDESQRQGMRELVQARWQGRTLLLATHDPADLSLTDTVYVYRDGTFIPQIP